MIQPAKRFQPGVSRQFFPLNIVYASRLGSFVDTVLRGLDRIFGGMARPVLVPVPARVSSNASRRRA